MATNAQRNLAGVLTTAVTQLLLIAAAIAVTGCSRQPPPVADTALQAATNTAVAQATEGTMAQMGGDMLNAKLDAAGIPVRYTARFDGDKLTHIQETRDADGRTGDYEFYGARLVKYSGAATASAALLLIEFDQQGALQSAQADPSPLANSEINAIKTRAALLRSHALAQKATKVHAG